MRRNTVKHMSKKAAVCALALSMLLPFGAAAAGEISDDYVTISKYKGVEVKHMEDPAEVTDEDVEEGIRIVLQGFAEVTDITDRPAQNGDTVVVDYTASVGGQVLEDGTVTDSQMVLGENSLFKGFDEEVVGHSTGDSFEITHTFAKDDTSTSLAGQTVTLAVTLKAVREVELPELTDEFVQTISQESDTVAEYREEVRAILESRNLEAAQTELENRVWEQVLNGTEVKKYPPDAVEQEKQAFYDRYQGVAKLYGMEFSELLDSIEMTEAQFEERAKVTVESNVKEDLVADLIAREEEITLTDEEYQEHAKELAAELSYSSVEEMEKEATAEVVRKYILHDVVKDWVTDHCVQLDE